MHKQFFFKKYIVLIKSFCDHTTERGTCIASHHHGIRIQCSLVYTPDMLEINNQHTNK